MTAGDAALDLSLLAVRLARFHGLRSIVGRGPVAWADIALAAPEIERLALEESGPGRRSRHTWSHRVLVGRDLTLDGLAWPADDVLFLDLDTAGTDQPPGFAAARPTGRPGVSVVARPATPDQLAATLTEAGLEPTFTGSQPAVGGEARAVAIVDRRVNAALIPAPPGFRVLAIVTAFNEEDIIRSTIESLIGSGLDVHLIDNWSTDRTHEIAERFLGRGLVGLERFPATPSATYDWGDLLSRVEEVAAASPSDWFIHHDSDERHLSPWPSRSLRDAIWAVQQSGFNAIDHTVLNFRPVDDGFVPGSDPEAYFRHFEFGTTPDDLHRIKAWRSTGGRVSLAASGGHEVRLPGRRVFPYKFLLKHYPIRSQAHGERKVLRERAARWNAAERARGWHVHYDAVAEGHRFLRSPHELREFDGRTLERELITIISGVGLAPRPVPRWATRTRLAATAYRLAAALLRNSVVGRLRRARLLKAPIVRRPGRWLRGRLLGTRQ